MGTRSNICIQYLDGSFKAIYCHWDGSPEYNGKILFEHYQDLEKINQLLDLGDLSSLEAEIGVKHPFDRPSRFTKNMKHSKAYDTFMKRYSGMCTAYARDRGEKDTEAKTYANYDLLCAMLEESWTEWVYIYRVETGKWYYTNNPSPTWFKTCDTEQAQTCELTPAAWEKEKTA